MSYSFDTEYGSVGDGEYKFIFDEDGLVGMESTETFDKETSEGITEDNFKDLPSCCTGEIKNNRFILKCNSAYDNDIIEAFNIDNKTKEDLKKTLETRTSLTCK